MCFRSGISHKAGSSSLENSLSIPFLLQSLRIRLVGGLGIGYWLGKL